MAAGNERLLQWLRSAHAMEEQAETMLSAQAARLENYPELRMRVQRHIEETQAQASRLESCLKQLGSDTSGLKDLASKFTAAMQGMGGVFAGDEVVKGAMAGYVFEHFEIASYAALIAAAESAGHPEVAAVCQENLSEEEAMAESLRAQLPGITQAFLKREEAGGPAKR